MVPPPSVVVDACVARRSGEGSEQARTCRDFLTAMLQERHAAAFSTRIREEWERHMSRFSRHWLVRMHARRLVRNVTPQPRDDLLTGLLRQCECPAEEDAARRDKKLLDAACATDRRIASTDEVARAFFSKASNMVEEIQTVLWVNPERPSGDAEQWLRDGAPHCREYCLGP